MSEQKKRELVLLFLQKVFEKTISEEGPSRLNQVKK